jgi:periplasmic protein CpxP/Spy
MIHRMGSIFGAVALFLLCTSGIAHAQGREGGGFGGGFGPRYVQLLTDSLQLNEEQQGQVKTILSEARSRMEAVFENAAGDREVMRAAMIEIAQGTNERIEKILTPEQLVTYARLREQMQQRARERERERSQQN